MRIAVAGHHPAVLTGIRLLLSDVDGWQVVAELGEPADAESVLRDGRIDALVLDMDLRRDGSLRLLARLAARSRGTPIVVVATPTDEAYARRALTAGAVAYIPKEHVGDGLVKSLHHALNGGG